MEWRGAVLALALSLALVASAFDDPHVSQMSPISASNHQLDQDSRPLETSDVIDLLPSASALPVFDSQGDEDEESPEEEIEKYDNTPHVVVVRSAAPILHDLERRSNRRAYDVLGSSKNVEEALDTNDVEVHQNQRYYHQIRPTRTQPQASGIGNMASSIMETGGERLKNQGEARGVPMGRALSPKGPQITSARKRDFASSVRFDSAGRQANPDIQDIITGIVKLLNGNVNVQANSQPANARPGRPQNSRINNRGPPRISDLPPLPPDFDTPGPSGPGQMMPPLPPQTSTKIPPPYPFDRPPPNMSEQPPHRPFLNGVPLPEQLVPMMNNQNNYRPNGFINGRPQNLPPWQRPRPRPQMPNRRPNPNLPMYKPQPPNMAEPPPHVHVNSEESFTSEAPLEEPVLRPKPHNEVYAEPEVTMPQENEPENEELQPEKEEELVEVEETEHKDDDNATNNETFTHKEPEYETADDEENSFVRDRDPPSSAGPPVTTAADAIQEEIVTTTTTEAPPKAEEPTKQQVMKEGEISDKKKQTMTKVEKEKPSNKKQEEKVKEAEQSVKNTIIQLGEEDAINNNTISFQNTPDLESSKVDYSSPGADNSTKLETTSSTPTEGLPTVAPSVNSTASSNSSVIAVTPTAVESAPTSAGKPGPPQQYRPRPGIVLDDPEYRPGQGRPDKPHQAPPAYRPHRFPRPPPGKGEIFDVTVSAIQGPGGGTGSATVHIESVNPLTGQPGDIIVSASGDQGFVSIDGKRTYLNLLGEGQPTSTQHLYRPTAVVKPTEEVTGTGYAVPEIEAAPVPVIPHRPSLPSRKTTHQPPVRIDTCIVGDDSTCDQTQNERCKTDIGISSCHCRPGYARRNHRDPCRKVAAMMFSLRVDRMYDRKITWDDKLSDRESESYQQLSFEAVRAVDSAFSMTPYSDEFVSGSVNTIYKGPKGDTGVFVNVTVLLEESGEMKGGADITRHLLGVIQRRSNNVGQSALWVDHTRGSVSPLQDLDECSSPELNDCHDLATCTNVWGSFKCACPEEARDAWMEQPNRAGRNCHTCPPTHCSNRGTCSYRGGQPVCSCTGAYYGSQCEVDGEVVGVAVGASLAALLVILITLACLVMWSRRWNREQKSAAGMGSPVFGYMTGGAKVPNMGHPPYQVSLEERMRWAQLADVMAQANHYAQPEPAPGHPGARPTSAMYGAYPTLPAGTLPPVPRPRLGLHMGGSTMHLNTQGNMNTGATITSRANTLSGLGHAFSTLSGLNSQQAESSSSESDSRAPDRTDLLGARGFHVPRPKSRSNTVNSMANQSGIYYDVDYENAPDPIYGTKGIPLSTYTMNRNQQYYGQ